MTLLDTAPPLIDFYFDSTVPPGAPLPQRTRAAEDVKRILARVKSDVQFELLVGHAATRLGVNEDLLRRVRAGTGRSSTPAASPAATPNWPAEERMLVEVMAADKEVARSVLQRGTIALLTNAELANAAQQIGDTWEHDQPLSDVLEHLPEALANRLTAVILAEGPMAGPAERMRTAEDCVKRIEQRVARARRQAIATELRRAESAGDESWRAKLENLNEVRRREEIGRE